MTQYEEQKVAAGEGLGIQAPLLARELEIKFITVICVSKASLTAGLPRNANCELTASISCDKVDIYNE